MNLPHSLLADGVRVAPVDNRQRHLRHWYWNRPRYLLPRSSELVLCCSPIFLILFFTELVRVALMLQSLFRRFRCRRGLEFKPLFSISP